jgi:isocitrate dehydrogenase
MGLDSRSPAFPKSFMSDSAADIVYTYTDEAPALATFSWLPIVQAFASAAGVQVQMQDISLAGRILAAFPECVPDGKGFPDALASLGKLAKQPSANIIKLPNISASIPQLNEAIAELRSRGYGVPLYPAEPTTDAEKSIKAKYSKVLGSAVKKYAQSHPHSTGKWTSDSRTHVAHMTEGDFYGSEKSAVISSKGSLSIVHTDTNGNVTVLRDSIAVDALDIVDASVMNVQKLRDFYAKEIKNARASGDLLSLHLKATMMKVSDPVLFGHAVSIYFEQVFKKHGETLAKLGVNPNNGLDGLESKIETLPADQRDAIRADIQATYEQGPKWAMVDSDKGITNLHVPSDVIIDASMPAAIRSSGKMWGPDGKLHDTKALIPDRCYAGVYQATIDFCRTNGAFDVTRMGTVNNVGLMAQKAEEYGSHDKTFEISAPGVVRVSDQSGQVLFEHAVEKGDLWRMCQTKDVSVQDWVRLAVQRARITGWPAVFWLDSNRPHDVNLIHRVGQCLKGHDVEGLELPILSPVEATTHACQRAFSGQDTISVTGNVLRDYLTDLFPILELGTSAKMLSIVPLLDGGGLFETGAGGSAPKHVEQFMTEGHLRWDSLGEFLALAVSLEDLSRKKNDSAVRVLADALDRGTEKFLTEDKSPRRDVGDLDTRGSHFYMAMYWAEALAEQTDDPKLAKKFAPIASAMQNHEQKIVAELSRAQGSAVDVGGYYFPDCEKAARTMRPSKTFNSIIDQLA